MKKVLISLMLVLLTICLFVGCSSSPSSKNNEAFCHCYEDGDYALFFKHEGKWIFAVVFSDDRTYTIYGDEVVKGDTVTFTETGDGTHVFNVKTGEYINDDEVNNRFICEKAKINSYKKGGLLSFTYKGKTISANPVV